MNRFKFEVVFKDARLVSVVFQCFKNEEIALKVLSTKLISDGDRLEDVVLIRRIGTQTRKRYFHPATVENGVLAFAPASVYAADLIRKASDEETDEQERRRFFLWCYVETRTPSFNSMEGVYWPKFSDR